MTVAIPEARFLASDRRVRVNVYDDRWKDSGTGTMSIRVGHLVQGDYTLCGDRAERYVWVEPDDTTTRCSQCAAVPEGHVIGPTLLALGITYRQMDHWIRRGWLTPDGNPHPGRGHQRSFPPEEYQAVAVVARLLAAGLTPAAAFRVARTGRLAPGITLRIEATA